MLEIDRDREDALTTDGTGTADEADGTDRPDLGPRPAVDLFAPDDLAPTREPTTMSSFAVDPEPGVDGEAPSRLTPDDVPTEAGIGGRIDPSDMDLIETGLIDQARVIRASDLTRPTPGEPEVAGDESETDASTSTGRFGTEAIDPGPEADTVVSTAGPRLDMELPDLDPPRDSEGLRSTPSHVEVGSSGQWSDYTSRYGDDFVQGLGWRVVQDTGRLHHSHGGGGPAFAALMRLYPDEGLGIAMLANGTNLEDLAITDAIASIDW